MSGNGPEFFQTIMGRRFFEGTLPGIESSLKRIATALEAPKGKPNDGKQPSFNHTRADGPYAPCDTCLEQMDRDQLLRLVKDMRGGRRDLRELLSRARAYIDATPEDINPEEREALIEDLESKDDSLRESE